DVVIATRASEMGMWAPGAQGPVTRAVEEHEAVGDVDIVVDDEAAAVAAVKAYLSYQRDLPDGAPAAGAEAIGALVPDDRRRRYDMRKIVAAFADDGSVLELRPRWARSLVTALARLGGRAIG